MLFLTPLRRGFLRFFGSCNEVLQNKFIIPWRAGIGKSQSTGLVIERSQVRVRQERRDNFLQGQLAGLTYFGIGIHSTPVLPQQHVKDPCHSARNAGSRLQLNTHAPLRVLLKIK